jgi:hypothetical protein
VGPRLPAGVLAGVGAVRVPARDPAGREDANPSRSKDVVDSSRAVEQREGVMGARMRMHSRAALGGVVAATVVLALFSACGRSSPSTNRESEIYAAAIRALVPPEIDEEDVSREVFVGQRDGTIPISLQSDILQELTDFDHLRFVDEPAEAIDRDPPRAVKNEGVYLEFRDVVAEPRTARVRVLRYVDADDRRDFVLDLERSGGIWSTSKVQRR